MNEKYDPVRFEQLLQEQYARFPSVSLPPEFAELLETNTLQLLIKLARYKFAACLLKAKDKVLEVGSGNGVGTIFLAQHVAHVTGLEIKPRDHEAACSINRRDNVELRLESVFDHDMSLLVLHRSRLAAAGPCGLISAVMAGSTFPLRTHHGFK